MKSEKLLTSFIAYCLEHPEERFWQALKNWCGWNFVMVAEKPEDAGRDTFYWEDNEEKLRNGGRVV